MLSHLLRAYSPFDPYLQAGKVLVLYGARQVGKTTLLQDYLATTSYRYRFDSGDNLVIREYLSQQDTAALKEYALGYDLIVIDEAQRIPNIGLSLKILVDTLPHLRIIATGSSSFELAGQVGEPLTGRKKTLTLYPIAQLELQAELNSFDLKSQLDQYLIYGTYPEIVTSNSNEERRSLVTELMQSYLLKDILELDRIKNSKALLDLLRLLAFQIGSEVSYNELGKQLGLDNKTVMRYLNVLEQSFVLYNLRGYSRNLRSEITKKSKYYFYDNGIRNALIANFNPLNIRDDVGKLWENFLVIERIKKQCYESRLTNNYFWRTWSQQEIDWVEECEGKLFAYEFKWRDKKSKTPSAWQEAYPDAQFKLIHCDNYLNFVGQES